MICKRWKVQQFDLPGRPAPPSPPNGWYPLAHPLWSDEVRVGVVITTIIITIIFILFLSWVNDHRNPACQERHGTLCRSRGWKVPSVNGIRCVWDEILVTADGFGAAMWEKCARSQRFGKFGRTRVWGQRSEDRAHIYSLVPDRQNPENLSRVPRLHKFHTGPRSSLSNLTGLGW